MCVRDLMVAGVLVVSWRGLVIVAVFLVFLPLGAIVPGVAVIPGVVGIGSFIPWRCLVSFTLSPLGKVVPKVAVLSCVGEFVFIFSVGCARPGVTRTFLLMFGGRVSLPSVLVLGLEFFIPAAVISKAVPSINLVYIGIMLLGAVGFPVIA